MIALPRRCVAEALGTFALIFIGCGAVVVSTLPGAGFGLLGIALAHALVLGVMITATMNISGGHHNPAVTLGLLSTGRISVRDAGAYVASQLVGGALGAFMLTLVIPAGITHAGTLGTFIRIIWIDNIAKSKRVAKVNKYKIQFHFITHTSSNK